MTGGGVVVPACIVSKRTHAGGCVVEAGGVVFERSKTGGRVGGAGCEIEERIIALSRVFVGIPSVRCRW
jgi:hypothetical protein